MRRPLPRGKRMPMRNVRLSATCSGLACNGSVGRLRLPWVSSQARPGWRAARVLSCNFAHSAGVAWVCLTGTTCARHCASCLRPPDRLVVRDAVTPRAPASGVRERADRTSVFGALPLHVHQALCRWHALDTQVSWYRVRIAQIRHCGEAGHRRTAMCVALAFTACRRCAQTMKFRCCHGAAVLTANADHSIISIRRLLMTARRMYL